MSLEEGTTPAATGESNANTTIDSVAQAIQRVMNGFIGGKGQHHTNDIDPAKPDKKLTPYTVRTWADVTSMVDNPSTMDKKKGSWAIFSDVESRKHKIQEEHGRFSALWFDRELTRA